MRVAVGTHRWRVRMHARGGRYPPLVGTNARARRVQMARCAPRRCEKTRKKGLRPYARQAEMCLDAFQTQPSVGGALGPHALSGECPPASACGRHLPLYFASKGMGAQRPTHRQRQKSLASPAYRKPSPVAAGRLLGKIKEEAAPRPGNICARGLPAATGPSRSRPASTETPSDPNGAWTLGHPRNVVITLGRRKKGPRRRRQGPWCVTDVRRPLWGGGVA